MNAPLVVAMLLALAVLLGVARSLRDARPHRRARCVLQALVGAALWLGLFPPSVNEPADANLLVVLTPGGEPVQRASLPDTSRIVALPGADAARTVERVPDLATALRRYPDARRLRIVGGGLPPRDLDAARGRIAAFDAAPLPRGLVEVDAASVLAPGARWRIDGRIAGLPGGRVELLDPSGNVAVHATPDADGRFMLEAHAKDEGRALFALRIIDAAGAQHEHVTLPLLVRDGAALRVLVLAGAPDPDLKYLRRWAVDGGLRLDSRIVLSEGIALTEGKPALDAEALAETDLVVLDERVWAALGVAEKAALRAAVDEGLGLLLRVTGAVDDLVAADWATLGFRLGASDAPGAVKLGHASDRGAAGAALTRRAITVDADGAAPLLRAGDGSLLAAWHAMGQGRVGLWWLADSFRLALAGDGARHADLWASTFSTLARARSPAPPQPPSDARVDQRAVLCGVNNGDRVEAPDGTSVALVVDGAATSACAAYWPTLPGWHDLLSGTQHWPFHVRAADEAPGLAAFANARATRALLGTSAPTAFAQQPIPLPRWPFLLAWLAAAAALWTLERRRA